MAKITLRVMLCGNCNPRYDVRALLFKIASRGKMHIVFDRGDCDLVVNGCEVCCVKPESFSPCVTVVSGYFVNGLQTDKESLEATVISELMKDVDLESSC